MIILINLLNLDCFASKINALLRRTKNDSEKSLFKVSGVIIDRDMKLLLMTKNLTYLEKNLNY